MLTNKHLHTRYSAWCLRRQQCCGGWAHAAFLSHPLRLITCIFNEKPFGFGYRHFAGAWHRSRCAALPALSHPSFVAFLAPRVVITINYLANNTAINNLYRWVKPATAICCNYLLNTYLICQFNVQSGVKIFFPSRFMAGAFIYVVKQPAISCLTCFVLNSAR